MPTGQFSFLPKGFQCTGSEWSLYDCGLVAEDCGVREFAAVGQEDVHDFAFVKCGAMVSY